MRALRNCLFGFLLVVATAVLGTGSAGAAPGNGAFVNKYDDCATVEGIGVYCEKTQSTYNDHQTPSGRFLFVVNSKGSVTLTREAPSSCVVTTKFSSHTQYNFTPSGSIQENHFTAKSFEVQTAGCGHGVPVTCSGYDHVVYANGEFRVDQHDMECVETTSA